MSGVDPFGQRVEEEKQLEFLQDRLLLAHELSTLLAISNDRNKHVCLRQPLTLRSKLIHPTSRFCAYTKS